MNYFGAFWMAAFGVTYFNMMLVVAYYDRVDRGRKRLDRRKANVN